MRQTVCLMLLAPLLARAAEPTTRPTTRPAIDTRMRSPEQTIASIQLPPGYHLQLVPAEPTIINPVLCTWDGNGRMYVAEMRTYMADIDGKGTMEKTSRVSRLESTRGDGVYDKI